MIYRYRFISEHRASYGVQRLCRVLGVRRQGFYEWCAARPGRDARGGRDEDLAMVITRVHHEHRGRYGRPRITTELRRRGIQVNHKRVRRVMSELGLAGITRRRRRTLTSPALVPAEPVADLIGRDFTAEGPGERLVGDITCLITGQGRLFLATVIDLYNREVVGHALGPHATTGLVTDAIALAAARGLISENAVFHSDRGTQYTAHAFRQALAGQQMRPSIGRKGSCYDNAVAEAFFATLKTELPTTAWATRDQARSDIFAYLRYYNHDRLHSTNGHQTPAETRMAYAA